MSIKSAPEYSEPDKQALLLLLRNNIFTRRTQDIEQVLKYAENSGVGKLSAFEVSILVLLFNQERITTRQVAEAVNKSVGYANKTLKKCWKKACLVGMVLE